jgi:hypothetical protein
VWIVRRRSGKAPGRVYGSNHLFRAERLPQNTRATRASHRQEKIVRWRAGYQVKVDTALDASAAHLLPTGFV